MSTHPALSERDSFFFFFGIHPFFLASFIFFAALLSARLRRLLTLLGVLRDEFDGVLIHMGKALAVERI